MKLLVMSQPHADDYKTVSGSGFCWVVARCARAAGPPVVASASRSAACASLSAACASRSTIGSSSAWPGAFRGFGFDDGFAFGFAADCLVAAALLAGIFGAGLLTFFNCATPRVSRAALPGFGGL